MSERAEVQHPLLRYAAGIGWTVIAAAEALTLCGAARKQTGPEELFRAMLVGGVDDGEGEGEGGIMENSWRQFVC